MADSATCVPHSDMPRTRSALFDRWSVVYDRPGVQGATYRPVHNAVIARLTDVQPSVVVDLGCGTGQLTQRLAERFPDARVIGIDYSAGMLGEAAGRVGVSASLMQAEAHRLPIHACSVDVVVCTESFHWYRDQADVLAGLAAVLRPGGQLLIASIASITAPGTTSCDRCPLQPVSRSARCLPDDCVSSSPTAGSGSPTNDGSHDSV